MSDLNAMYNLNTAENLFSGYGYAASAGPITMDDYSAPTPASTAPTGKMDTHHHTACVVAVLAGLLFLTHHFGFRGVVATG